MMTKQMMILSNQTAVCVKTNYNKNLSLKATCAWYDCPVVQNVSAHNVALRELKQI
jgi:hypothetical protein